MIKGNRLTKALALLWMLCLVKPVFGQAPDWSVNASDFSNSMNVVGFLWIDKVESEDSADLIAAFVNGEVRGVVSPVFQAELNRYVVFLTVFSNSASEQVSFKAYDSSADQVIDMVDDITFVSNGLVGGLERSFIWSNVALESGAELLTYSLPGQVGDTRIDNSEVEVDVNLVTDVSALIAEFTASSEALVSISGVEQVSGVTKNDYTNALTLKVQSENGLNITNYTITVKVVNQSPEQLSVSGTSLAENSDVDTEIGELSVTDDETIHTYRFASGEGDDDNHRFDIQGKKLVASEVFDFEAQAEYSVRVEAEDGGGNTTQAILEIKITDVNEAPEAILLSNGSIDENSADGTIIGNLSSSDPDAGDLHQYTLIAGAGDEGNSSFLINEAGQLVSAEVFDFEKQANYSIRVQSTDAGGLSLAQVFAIEVVDVNEGSTVIALSDNQLEENNSVGGVIGSFSTTDPDNAETFTYALVAGTGDTDNSSFEIDGNSLKAAASFDHEIQSSYSIRVRSTDSQSNELETVFSITVQDLNEAPTALELSNSTVAENQTESISIGSLSTTDVDDGDTFVYSFATGDGDTDNELFTIQNGNELFSTTSFDFETRPSYSVRIKSTDQAGESIASDFTLTITDVNDVPTEVMLSKSDLDENNSVNAVIGSFSSTDQDVGDTHVYSLTAGTGDEDNASFSINENGELLAAESFDFEQQASYAIRVTSTDASDATLTASFTITINDVNEGSTVIALSENQLAENNTVGDAIGSFSTTDPDNAETFTYALVAETGDTDNASFEIEGSTLKAAASFDHETQSSYSIRVRSTDSQSNELEAVFSITVQDVNETPTALELSNSTVAENQAESIFIGSLSTADVDDGDTFVYSFASGDGDTNNELFTIQNGNELFSTTSFDFETRSNYSVRIKSTDQVGESVTSEFMLTITDVNDAPTEITLSQKALDENNSVNAVIGSFGSVDQDVGDIHSYSLTAGTGDEDNASFGINDNGELLAAESFDFEQQASYAIRVTSTDASGAKLIASFTIIINDVNEGSTVIALSDNQLEENNTVGDAIGDFSTTDPDNAETFSYELVIGEGDTDNTSFEIDGNSLKAAASFDHETQSSYSIRVRSTDSQSNELEAVFSITVQDVNETPTALELSNSTVAENQTESISIGSLSTADVDDGDTFVYSFATGDGDTDNELFTIQNGNELFSTTSFDFETQSNYSVRIKSTDQAGESVESDFTLTITNVNDAPAQIILSQNSLDENNSVNAVIGSFSTTDQDAGDTHSYSLTAGTGDEDNTSFIINENGELLAAESFDFEQQASYSIRVETTDAANAVFATSFIITINNVNEGSTTIFLSDSELEENNVQGEVIGTFSTTDPDNAETFTYELVTGEGDADNTSFELEGDNLKAAETFDFEQKQTYSIRVRSTAFSTGAIEAIFSITIQNANDAPSAIELSNQSVNENNTDDHLIGTLSTSDEDITDQHIYSLTSGEGDTHNGFFAIRNTNELVLTQSVDFEANERLELRLVSIDNAGGRLESAFVIEVGNLPEPLFSTESSIAFDLTGIGESKAQTLTVSNTGPDGNLVITDVRLTGPFSIDVTAADLSAGQSADFEVTFTPTERGEFSGTVTFQTSVGEKTVLLTGTGELVTGLEDLPDFSNQVQVFPNPATTLLMVDVSVFRGRPVNLTMLKLSGIQVQDQEISSDQNEIRIDVSALSQGIYILVLSSGTASAKKKVIIK